MTRIVLGATTAVVLAASLVTLPLTAPAASATPAAAVTSRTARTGSTTATGHPAGPTTEVILPTGDRVVLRGFRSGVPSVLVRPRAGGPLSAATVLSANGHTYVVPQAAAGLIGHGLDLSLFDVTALAGAARRPSTQPLSLAATFGPSYTRLPVGLTRTSSTSVDVTDPAAFGSALARSWATEKQTGRIPTLLRGVELRLPGSPVAAHGRLTSKPAGKLYTVTINGLDRSGHKDSGDIGVVTNVDNTNRFIAGQTFFRGTFSFSVPRGSYSVQSFISTVDRKGTLSYTLATNPQFLVNRDVTITLDARDGTRFSATTPRPSSAVHGELNLQRNSAHGPAFTDSLSTFDPTPLYATPTDPVTVGRLHFYPGTRLGDANGSLSRYLYDLEFPSVGSIPGDLTYDVTAADLATVHAGYASVVPARTEEESRLGGLPWQTLLVGAINDLVAPMSRTEYVTALPRLAWHQEVDLDVPDGAGRMLAPAAIYHPGETVAKVWSDQPSGSGLEQEYDGGQACPVCRSGDTLAVTAFPHVDSSNDFMLADGATTENMTLYQDGTEVGQSRGGFASFPLSADPASYQLVYDVDTTAAWWPTSTHVSTTWSFRSRERPPNQLPPGWTCGGKQARRVDDGCSFEHVLLPHYVASAGLDGVIPAGTVAHIDVDVSPQRGLRPDPLTSLTGQVSYDGGKNWKAVTATRSSDTSYRLSYRQPKLARTDGYASLRIDATAKSGSKVSQTVIHGYPLTTPGAPTAPAGSVASSASSGAPAASSSPARALGCAAPVQPPLTRCLAVADVSAGMHPDAPVGYGPADLRKAYDLPGARKSQATVAIVTPYDDPNAAVDLAAYRKEFGLPACSVGSGCLTKVNQDGQSAPLPPSSSDWGLETSLALDAISATCPTCKILLVEADSPSLDDLAPAAVTASRLHADVISGGYGTTGEFSGEQLFEKDYRSLGVPFVVASGNYGYGNGAPIIGSVSYPSASRFAVAVGGTTLTPAGNDRGFTETAWSSTTSGCSAYIAKPRWQHDPLCAKRTTADVAAVADPSTGLAVYDTFGFGGWQQLGGTSAASAIVAGVFGLRDRTGSVPAGARLYRPGAGLFDVTEGANGRCRQSYLCTAAPGYDGPSGVGTPDGISAF